MTDTNIRSMNIREQNSVGVSELISQGSLSLRSVSLINERMKRIVRGSNRLYIISLNAMFSSRSATNGGSGFIEVTALLRDFSQRLDKQVESITTQIDNLILQSALVIKKQKHNKLLLEAIELSDGVSVPAHVYANDKKLSEEINALSDRFSLHLVRCEKFMKIGENLSVLAKVEAAVSADDATLLEPITHDMAETINRIGECLNESQLILAA